MDLSTPQSPIEEAFLAAWRRRFPTVYLETQYWVMGIDAATHEARRYRVDFAYPEKRLLIELDGYEWHAGTPDVFTKHTQRQRDLEAEGWHFVRFTGSEIWANPEQCAIMAWNRLLALPKNRKPIKPVTPPPNTLPQPIAAPANPLPPSFSQSHSLPNRPLPVIASPRPTGTLPPSITTRVVTSPQRDTLPINPLPTMAAPLPTVPSLSSTTMAISTST